MNSTGKTKEDGITLLEVVIAAAVLTVCSLIAYPTYLSYMDLSSQNIEENIAIFDLETAFEELKTTPFLDLKTLYPDGSNMVKFNYLHLQNERVTVNYLNSSEDPLYIRLEVSWRDFQRNTQTRAIVTALTK